MKKQKVKPAVIALIAVLALILVGITAKVLSDRYAPSSVNQSIDELEKNIDNIKKSPN